MPPKLQLQQKALRSSSVQDNPKASPGPLAASIDKGKQLKLVQDSEGALGCDTTGEKENVSDLSIIREDVRLTFEKSDGKIIDRLATMDTKFTGMFNDLRQELTTLKTDMGVTNKNLESVSNKVDDIEKSVDFQSKSLDEAKKTQTDSMEKSKQELEAKIKQLDDKLLLMEKHDRKYNLLFYGIKEEKDENVYDKMRELFISDLELDDEKVQSMYFAHGHRLPSRSPGPKRIILRFLSFEERELVLSNAYKLGGSRRRIVSDLPLEMKKERGRLSRVAHNIRKKDLLQTRIKDKGLEVYLEVRRD